MANGADPVGAVDVVLPASLADSRLAHFAESSTVDDPSQFRTASPTRPAEILILTPQVVHKVVVAVVIVVGGSLDLEGPLLLEHGEFGFQPAGTQRRDVAISCDDIISGSQ